MTRDLHLVGSIPLDTVEEVFSTFDTTLGLRLHSLPDGGLQARAK